MNLATVSSCSKRGKNSKAERQTGGTVVFLKTRNDSCSNRDRISRDDGKETNLRDVFEELKDLATAWLKDFYYCNFWCQNFLNFRTWLKIKVLCLLRSQIKCNRSVGH